MIAVFAKDRDYRELHLTPKNMFVRVHTTDDIRGRKFTGVIEMYDWSSISSNIGLAYSVLKERQPELFKV